MALPYLTFSELGNRRQDVRGSAYGGAISSVANSMVNVINDYRKMKDENAKMILDPAKDINKLVNKSFRLVGLQDYNDFRGKWSNVFKEQKGRFTPEQKLELQDDLMGMQSKFEYYNQVSKLIDAAKKESDGNVYRQFDDVAMNGVMESLIPDSNGRINMDKFNESISKGLKSTTGMPFLNYAPLNSDYIIDNIKKKHSKGEKLQGEHSTTKEKGGMSYTTKQKVYIPTMTAKEIKSGIYSDIMKMKPEAIAAMEYDLSKKMSDEAMKEADNLYPDSKIPLLTYKIENLEIDEPEERIVEYKSESPKTKKEGEESLLDKKGKTITTAFGLSSNDFVDYSREKTSERTLRGFILPEGSEEHSFDTRAGDLKMNFIKQYNPLGKKEGEPLWKSSKDTGKVGDYEIVGHDRQNDRFWIMPVKPETIDKFGEKIEVDKIITVPANYVLGKDDPKRNDLSPITQQSIEVIGNPNDEDKQAIEWLKTANKDDSNYEGIYNYLRDKKIIK